MTTKQQLKASLSKASLSKASLSKASLSKASLLDNIADQIRELLPPLPFSQLLKDQDPETQKQIKELIEKAQTIREGI